MILAVANDLVVRKRKPNSEKYAIIDSLSVSENRTWCANMRQNQISLIWMLAEKLPHTNWGLK